MEFTPKQICYGCLGGGLLAVMVTFMAGAGSPFAMIAGIVAAFFFFLAILTFKYGYWIMPFITKGLRVVEVRDGGYIVPASQEAILKRVGGIYYASIFLMVKIYESTTDKTPEENILFSEYFERAISSVNFVTKFCMMVYMKDLSKYREKIETKRAEAQLKLAREREKPDPDVLRIDRFEREVAMWDGHLAKLSSGEKPMGAVSYLMTTGTGVTQEAAIAAAKAQANELKATITNALNVDVVLLKGEDMKRCFEWEFMMPASVQELEEHIAI